MPTLLTILVFLAAILTGWVLPPAAQAEDCARARRLFEKSLATTRPATQKNLLNQAVSLCPGYAEAYNNLALIWEREGRLGQAAQYYRRALEVRPGFCAPLAGLGDIAYAQGRFSQATGYYLRFLEGLPGEKKRGDPHHLTIHEHNYRAKLERARLKASILQASMTQVVKRQSLVRGLDSPAIHRGPSGAIMDDRLALWLNFPPGGDHLGARAKRQLRELARALATPRLRGCRLRIVGHADQKDGSGDLKALSLARAQGVRKCLVGMGVEPDRLQVAGLGREQPLTRNPPRRGRSLDSRVELVNLGR